MSSKRKEPAKPTDVAEPPATPELTEAKSKGEVVVRQKPRLEALGQNVRPIIPRNLEETYRYAQWVCASGICPDTYLDMEKAPDVQKVIIGILKALEVGLPPITGLSCIAIINNRPCIWGDGAVALIHKSGKLVKMTIEEIGTKPSEKEDTTAKYENDYGIEVKMWRKDSEEPYVGRFTVGDAKRAKLWGNPKKDPWVKYPRRQMKWRAFSWAARDGFADVLAGLQIGEEIQDLPQELRPEADTSFLHGGIEQVEPPAPQPQEPELRQEEQEEQTDKAPVGAADAILEEAEKMKAAQETFTDDELRTWKITGDEANEKKFLGSFMHYLNNVCKSTHDMELLRAANAERLTPKLHEAIEKKILESQGNLI